MKAPADALDYYRAALEKTPKKDRSVLYNKCGITELQLSRFEDSQRDFVNSIKRDKKNAEAINNLGVSYFFRHQYGKAISSYQKAIQVGEMVGENYIVRAGIKDGDQVIVSNLQKLADGAPVKPTA